MAVQGDCSACGRANRVGAHFCAGCGAALARTCESCGNELALEARFCDAWGAPAGLAETVEASRRSVSVVFSDLAGSTAMQEALDRARASRRRVGRSLPGRRPRRLC